MAGKECAKTMFKFFDENNDGGISLGELKEALGGVGVKFSDKELNDFFNKYDADKNGILDFNEFVALSMSLSSVSQEENAMAKLFASIDADGNKSLTKAEIREGIKNFTGQAADDAEIEALIKKLDIDGDGEISYEEFSNSILTKITLAIKNK